jgi:outer membrane autotransporter protein
LAGFGSIGLKDDNGDPANGFGVSLFGGYDFWVGKQWSIGPGARFIYVHTERDVLDAKFKDNGTSFQLLFSVLFH